MAGTPDRLVPFEAIKERRADQITVVSEVAVLHACFSGEPIALELDLDAHVHRKGKADT